jgi:hypothetical protein
VIDLASVALVVALAAPQGSTANFDAAVDGAIDRGVDFLLASQNRDGSWGTELYEQVPHFDKRNGESSLALYTLLKCRVGREHPAVQRALTFLEQGFPTTTYAVASQMLAFEALGDPKRAQERLRQLFDVLLETRIGNQGVWGYPVHATVPLDLSNTQYAALALRAAQHAGFKVPKDVWLELASGVLAFQQTPPKGATGPLECGFGYTPGEREQPTASMTAAGASVLALVEHGLGKSIEPPVQRSIDAAQARALAWLARNFDVAGNPKGHGAWHFYWLYGLERVGALLGVERIGEHDWYREGAEQLLREQKNDGSWRTGGPAGWPAEPLACANTCFALLFLSRATAHVSSGESAARAPSDAWAAEGPTSDVWLRAAGRSKLSIWVSGFAPRTLERLPELHVERVEFLVDERVIESVSADPSQPWKGERFACQYAFEADGPHVVRAEVTAVDAAGAREVLSSAPLTIVARDVFQPWLLEYARESAAEGVHTATPTAAASSQLNAWSHAAAACDGLQGTSWLCAADDATPTLTIALKRPLRAKSVLLGHANANARERDRWARATKVRVSINDDAQVVETELGPDVLRKAEVALDKPVVVRRLAIRVLAMQGGTENARVSGFAEVELR